MSYVVFIGHFVRGCLNKEPSTGCETSDKTAQWITNVRFVGIAFVTFKRLVDAKRMVKDHQGKCRCFSNPTSSTLSNLLEPWNWSVRVSPPPEDIYWENLTESHRLFFFKTLVINFFLFILLFFLTSPATIISQLEAIIHLKSLTQDLPEKVNDFVPTLLLWTLSALLPIIVAYSGMLKT